MERHPPPKAGQGERRPAGTTMEERRQSPVGFDAAVNSAIGRRLRCRREELALTREKPAECAEISVQFLADIETGRKGMTVQTLRKLALALHCSADDLVFGAEPEAAAKFPALAARLDSLTPAQADLALDVLALVQKALPPAGQGKADGD